MSEELFVKGIIISVAPQGEYGRRAVILTDTLGKITAFASGAAKVKSKIIGAVRPMTCAGFKLVKGRGAYNLHTVEVIDSFEALSLDFDLSVYASYVLEAGAFFSTEGMPEEDAKTLLNLMYVTMKALRDRELETELIRRIYELRLMVLQGEYTTEPSISDGVSTEGIWQRCIRSPLSVLYDPAVYEAAADISAFTASVEKLYKKQVDHKFKTLEILRDL